MRLSQVAVMIAASFLVASEAFPATTDSNQYKAVEDEYDSSEEERAPLSRAQVKALVKEVGIDWKMVKANPMYLQRHENYKQYLDKMNEILAKQKSKGDPIYKNP